MPWLGLFLGALIGTYVHGFPGLVVGATAGVVIGFLLRRRPLAAGAQRAAASDGVSAAASGPAAPAPAAGPADARRIAALEQRLSALETALARSGIAVPAPTPDGAPPSAAGAQTADAERAQPASAELAAVPIAAPAADVTPAARSPVRKGGSGEPGATAAARGGDNAIGPAAATPSLWAWFTGGNAMVRIGIVILFFGVAFLLSYFAEHVTVPIELQFAGVALFGGAMIGAGLWLRNSRRAYALALAGGGLGVLYLTTFAALQLVPLLSPASAFALLAAIAVLAIVLSLAFDAQALAALAALGGLLAPVLVATVSEPVPLFGYVAAVNVVVLGIAWFRAWRALDLVGFVGTFVLGLWWGHEYYDPAYFAVVEPFLATFFLAYLAVPIVHALRDAGERRVDATLIFGVPIVTLALQALLVQDTRHGLAWTAAAGAVMYAILWRALRRSKVAGSAPTLAAAFGALAVIFATLTVPLAVDARWTSAIWAVEAAGVYWIGCREDRIFGRGFALLLQVATGAAFLFSGFEEYAEVAFANRQFLGSAAIALSAFASVRFGDRCAALPAPERSLLHLLFGWACAWWLGGGLAEIARHVGTRDEAHAMLAWTVGSIALAALLARPLRWPRLDGTAVVLLPALALALGHDIEDSRTSVFNFGWAVYPAAWALHFALLHRREARATAERVAATARQTAGLRQWLAAAHAFGALLLLGQIAWEAGEWTARAAAPGSVWAACAHVVPLALYLMAVAPAERAARWPLRAFANAYAVIAGTVVAIGLGLAFVALALLNPGDPRPLPYAPVANPLDLTLALALAAMFLWAQRDARLTVPALYRWLGGGVFIMLNGIVLRTVHHWLGVPWQLQALLASRPLQAALTLTWTVAALGAMLAATKRRLRALWFTGAGLLAVVVVKLFAIDLATLSGLSRVIAFLGVGALLLVIGYAAPLPPAPKDGVDA